MKSVYAPNLLMSAGSFGEVLAAAVQQIRGALDLGPRIAAC